MASNSPGEDEVAITVSRDGPLLLRGRLRIVDAAGETIATADAAALCRCGATGNPPFCDGSHKVVHFQAPSEPERRGR